MLHVMISDGCESNAQIQMHVINKVIILIPLQMSHLQVKIANAFE